MLEPSLPDVAAEGPLAPPPDNSKSHKTIARVFQCPAGEHWLRQPVVKLPCGLCVCQQCLPQSQRRAEIVGTWPGTPDRLHGIKCPCCHATHATGDCSPDYLSNAALKKINPVAERFGVTAREEDHADNDNEGLERAFAALSLDSTLGDEDGVNTWARMENWLRPEMDCAVCQSLVYDPWTTTCGHTFCKHCITRCLAVSMVCPTCRSPVSAQGFATRKTPLNSFITRLTHYFWLDEIQRRKGQALDESVYPRETDNEARPHVPLFVCTVSLPRMPTPLHVFEPRYREMVRRVWNGGKHFGMVRDLNARVGCHLFIEEFSMLDDGRSLLDTIGTSRFVVHRKELHPHGYVVAEVGPWEDVTLDEEEALEAQELGRHERLPAGYVPETMDDLNRMSTHELMAYAGAWMLEMEALQPDWLQDKILMVYGQCPRDDPVLFPWWLGSLLPLKEPEKQRLLETDTVRARMKICCEWIMAWRRRHR